MSIKKLSISLDEDVLKLVEEKKEHLDTDRSSVIEVSLEWYFALINHCKKDLFNTFNDSELLLFIDSLKSTKFCAKTIAYLPRMVADAIEYEHLDVKWEVNKEEILDKLNSLSATHYHSIVDFSQYYWAETKKDAFGDSFERIKKLKNNFKN